MSDEDEIDRRLLALRLRIAAQRRSLEVLRRRIEAEGEAVDRSVRSHRRDAWQLRWLKPAGCVH